MTGRVTGSRCGRTGAAQQYYLGAAIAHKQFGGPEPTGAEVMALFDDDQPYPGGTEMARLAGFCWQYARSISDEPDRAEGNGRC